MFSHRIALFSAAACFVAVFVFCVSAGAQRTGSSKFKKGDPVEVEVGFEWVPGTVVGVDRLGWIDVKIERSEEKSDGTSSSFRHLSMTQNFPPSSVRPGKRKPPAAPTTPERTWTDRTGKFSVKAHYNEMKGNNVVLTKVDGKTIEVPIEKLSDADASYIKELAQAAADNPFTETSGAIGPTASSDSSSVPSAPSGPIKKANWHEVKQVRPQTFSKWSFVPTGRTSSEMMQLAAASDLEVPLHEIEGSKKFFEQTEAIHISGDGNRVIVCRLEGQVAQDKRQFFEVVDAAKKQAGGLVALPDGTKLLDVDADTGQIAYRPEEFGFGHKSLLTIARLDGDKLATVTQWEPYVHEDWEPRRDIHEAWFLGGNRLMTINESGNALTVWDVDACKALANIPVSSSMGLKMSLSPDRKLLAIVMEKGIAIIDLAAPRHVATIPTKGQEIGRVEFRGDNARLAGMSSQGVVVWDLTNGQIAGEFASDVLDDHSPLAWAGEYLLVKNQFLFDLYRRVILWEYQDGGMYGTASKVRDGRMFFVPKAADNATTTLVSAALPHAGALELAKSMPSAEELLVVKPGDSVAIEVEIDPSVQLTEEVQQALTANLHEANSSGAKDEKVVVLKPGGAQSDMIRQSLAAGLQSSGLKVADHADLVVKAVCKPEPPQTIRVRIDNRFPRRPEDIVERLITPHSSYLEMKLGDKVLWKRGYVARPQVLIDIREGETLDQSLERYTRPNIRIFMNNKFSPYVARPGTATESGAYGVSKMTTRGVIDGQSTTGKGGSFE